jgi:hypothetical protein
MLTQNSYTIDTHIIQSLHNNNKKYVTAPQQAHKKDKWAIFTYYGHETQKITRIFKDTRLKIAYRTNNTIRKHLFKKHEILDKYDNSGIYAMKCLDCPRQYIGQTGRPFKTRYKEHIRHNSDNSTYTQHILNNTHTYGNINDTMRVINITQKGRHMNSLEKYHIYRAYRNNAHMNKILIDTHNPIFETLYEHQKTERTHRGQH